MSVSIRTRLLLLVMAVLLPAVAAALWVVRQAWQDEQRGLENHLRDSTRALSMVVDQELSHRAVIARILSLSRMLDAAPQVPGEELQLFEQQARRAMQGLRGWIEIHAADGELLNTRLPASSRAAPAAYVLSDQPLVGALEAGASGGDLRAAVTQPVQRNGQTLLNISVTILPAELQAIIDQQRLPPDWVGAVLDSRGIVVARHPDSAQYVGKPATPDLKRMLVAHREAAFESVSLDGRQVFAYYKTSPQGWTYITAVPRDVLAGGRTRALLPVVSGALALLLLGLVGALWVSRRIERPIHSLKASAAALQAGQGVPAGRTGIVECDAVAIALGEAATSIADAQANLQRQVDAAVARTREAEQRISQSQRSEALGRLTGGVAHDFNNLLGVISNSAHLIDRQLPAGLPNAPVAAILRAVDAGSRLTQHLLRFAGRQPVRPQPVELSLYLKEQQELLQTVLGKRIQLDLDVAAGTRRVQIDPAELELALINMALNARDAITGTGTVRIRARNAAPPDLGALTPGEYVQISFGDDGQGMDEELAERAFEPFFTTKPVGKGSGLGLSQVHGFCVQAGGTAQLASTVGLGTTVLMLLPAGGEGQALTLTPPKAQPAGQDTLAGARVLLVEDNDELGRITAALLVSFGCVVERARAPQEALALFAQAEAPFDVVLTDVVMPGGMDGVALARSLREQQPDLPVVLISGFSEALNGAHEFAMLRKPCAPAQLLSTLQRTMSERGRGKP